MTALAWLAAGWATTFLTLCSLALLDRVPHPWVPDDASPLAGLAAVPMSWCLVVVASLVLGALAVAARRPAARRPAGCALVAVGLAVVLVIADVRALAFLGYLPMLVLALVGVGPAAGHLDAGLVVDSAAALAHAIGGMAVVATGVRLLGRPSWGRWTRWGPRAVAVAIVVPLLYAATRIAWALDIPLGVRREMLDELGSARYAGLGLALFAVVGALLTWGLQARWGEVFWTWLPRYGGRPVPVALALVPGLLVAGAVSAAGISFWRMLLAGDIAEVPGATSDWAAWAPELLWPLWGAALAVGCLAYLGRRRAVTGDRRGTGGVTDPGRVLS